jgi:hypothetical protein
MSDLVNIEDAKALKRMVLPLSLVAIGATLALAETGSEDSFESLHQAASRATKHLYANRARRVDAPSPQPASERREGITTTQDDGK